MGHYFHSSISKARRNRWARVAWHRHQGWACRLGGVVGGVSGRCDSPDAIYVPAKQPASRGDSLHATYYTR